VIERNAPTLVLVVIATFIVVQTYWCYKLSDRCDELESEVYKQHLTINVLRERVEDLERWRKRP